MQLDKSIAKIFLDVDDLEDIHDLKMNVELSDNLALLLTEGVFEKFCNWRSKKSFTTKSEYYLDRCSFPEAEGLVYFTYTWWIQKPISAIIVKLFKQI